MACVFRRFGVSPRQPNLKLRKRTCKYSSLFVLLLHVYKGMIMWLRHFSWFIRKIMHHFVTDPNAGPPTHVKYHLLKYVRRHRSHLILWIDFTPLNNAVKFWNMIYQLIIQINVIYLKLKKEHFTRPTFATSQSDKATLWYSNLRLYPYP